MKTVKIERVALAQILAATFGAFKVESDGVLLGEIERKKSGENFIVEAMQASQFSKRKPASFEAYIPEQKRWENFIDEIGNFHSHPYSITTKKGVRVENYGLLKLGKFDKIFMRDYYPDKILLIATLNPVDRIGKIILEETRVGGCFRYRGRLYKSEVGAYYLDGNRKRKAKLEVSGRTLREFFI